ncbi:MAG: hypothetical protein HZA54_04125 [Planctomycetes bacterium]|nr:hypothetical protein [Planctomycetota bacterium]
MNSVSPPSSTAAPGASPGVGLLRPFQAVLLLFVVVAGAAAFAADLRADPAVAWRDLLLANAYFVGVAVIAGLFVAIQCVCGAGWHTYIRRIPEAMISGYLPWGLLGMLALLAGGHSLYHWADAEAVAGDAVLTAKAAFLNPTGFAVRTVLYFALWIFLAGRLIRRARAQDATGDVAATRANVRGAAVFAVLFALSFSLATVDWLMSLEPHWFSTIYPWYVFSSLFVAALCWMTLCVLTLAWRGLLPQLNAWHLHDLGKYVFAFSMFWGYLWLSQYLLIWYSNIPEETVHFLARERTGWWPLFLANVGLNTALPFFALMPAACKRSPRVLGTMCLVLAFGHLLDVYLLVMPSALPDGPRLSWPGVAVWAGVAALFLLSVDRALRRAPLLPARDPYLVESLHHHGW